MVQHTDRQESICSANSGVLRYLSTLGPGQAHEQKNTFQASLSSCWKEDSLHDFDKIRVSTAEVLPKWKTCMGLW
eukprot:1257624-Amphidinium_carterae.2